MSRLELPLVPGTIRWLLVGAVAVTILTFSVHRLPDPDRLQLDPFGLFVVSIWLHGLAYACLAVVLVYALTHSPRPDWQLLLGVFVFVTAYGFGIELVQLGLASRTFDPTDALVNAVGAALAVVGWTLLLRYVRFYRVHRLEQLQRPLGRRTGQ